MLIIAGMSPSRNSPLLAATPPLARQDGSSTGLRDRPDKQVSPVYTRICTPPKHSTSSADPNHRIQNAGEPLSPFSLLLIE